MQLVDRADITVAAGDGGDGAIAWRREKYVAYGGPAGGDGGRGGSVYLWANPHMTTLLDFTQQQLFEAPRGEKGASKNCHGHKGSNVMIGVPCGTQVFDAETGDLIADLLRPYDRILVAKGGRGGRGNTRFATARRQAPYFAEPGEPGVRRRLSLQMKLIADVGVIGFPNAGKSTLISVISRARPKIADYPFTTLTPNLGVVTHPADSTRTLVVADLPGLITGASEGHGLGHDFLRHVERTRVLLHLIDAASLDIFQNGLPAPKELDDPESAALWVDLWAQECLAARDAILNELEAFSPLLAAKPQLLAFNKKDSVPPQLAQALVDHLQARVPEPVTFISAATQEGIEPLLMQLFAMAGASLAVATGDVVAGQYHDLPSDAKATAAAIAPLTVTPAGEGLYVLEGGRLMRWVPLIQWDEPRSLHAFMQVMKAMGVFDLLTEAGARPGDTVVVAGRELEFWPDTGQSEVDEAAEVSEDDDTWLLAPWPPEDEDPPEDGSDDREPDEDPEAETV